MTTSIVEERSCGCALGEIGWTTNLREIFSFSKLTGEGVTFVGNQMERIVDEVLPGTYGGSPIDYQFVEDEDERGYTRLTIWERAGTLRDRRAVASNGSRQGLPVGQAATLVF